jgi:hypothetical protein
MTGIDRRDFIYSAAALAALGFLTGCGRKEEAGESPDVLAPLIATLFPQKGVEPSVYGEIAAIVRRTLEQRPDWARLRSEGAAALNAAAGGDWAKSGENARIEAARSIVDTPFFRAVYQTALVEFYSDPRVWAVVGYPGASAEFGGYIDRGFDNIDWLPEETP